MILKTGFFNVAYVFMKFIAGVYTSVAKNYDMMMRFIHGFESETFFEKIQVVEDNIYVLVAVFMLFRITISLIEYLIDPDKINDKQQGGGKLVTRIIISLLLVVSFPIILKGVNRLQSDLLQDDSPLFKIFDVGDGSQRSELEELGSAKCNVKSAYKKGLITSHDDLINALVGCQVSKINPKDVGYVINNIDKNNYDGRLYSLDLGALAGVAASIGFPLSGAKMMTIAKEYYDVYKALFYWIVDNKKPVNRIDNVFIIKSDFEKKYYIIIDQDLSNEDIVYDDMVNSEGGAAFSRSIIGSFASDSKVITEATYSNDCDGGCKFLDSSDANDAVARIVENETNNFQFDIFICVICGIAIIIFILILLIEVVIRQFKIVVLNMLAPIAFISYMNPNDKVLSNWFQKYVGCFLDLFIKLLALQISVLLIAEVANTDFAYGGLAKILFYIGIFIFAKTVPNLLSDVLGLKNMGGTFKDSMNALKTAALIGVGGIAGGVAGAITARGVGRVGGFFGGLGRGLAGGAKGHPFSGAANQYKINKSNIAANANGSTWWGRKVAEVQSIFGTSTGEKAKGQISALENQKKARESLVDHATKEATKRNTHIDDFTYKQGDKKHVVSSKQRNYDSKGVKLTYDSKGTAVGSDGVVYHHKQDGYNVAEFANYVSGLNNIDTSTFQDKVIEKTGKYNNYTWKDQTGKSNTVGAINPNTGVYKFTDSQNVVRELHEGETFKDINGKDYIALNGNDFSKFVTKECAINEVNANNLSINNESDNGTVDVRYNTIKTAEEQKADLAQEQLDTSALLAGLNQAGAAKVINDAETNHDVETLNYIKDANAAAEDVKRSGISEAIAKILHIETGAVTQDSIKANKDAYQSEINKLKDEKVQQAIKNAEASNKK